MEREKILFVYEDEGEFGIESLWARKLGDYYQIDNIPFFVSHIALGDIVSVEKEADALYFDKLIEPSEHSTIQLVFFDADKMEDVLKELEAAGCSWEGSHIRALVSVDVPPNVPYQSVKKILDGQFALHILDYKEACLSTSARE